MAVWLLSKGQSFSSGPEIRIFVVVVLVVHVGGGSGGDSSADDGPGDC